MTTTRVFKIALDPTPQQEELLTQYAHAYRATYNWGWGIRNHFQQLWTYGRDKLVAHGVPPKEANKQAPSVPKLTSFPMSRLFRSHRARPFEGPLAEGAERRHTYPWWEGVNENMCCQAFADLDRAWANWQAGRARYPRPKNRQTAKLAFRVQAIKSLPGHRHVQVPGSRGHLKAFRVRLHASAAPMLRTIKKNEHIKGCGMKGVTFAKEGPRWFACFNVSVPERAPAQPNKHQKAAGVIGVDLGVREMAYLTGPLTITSKDKALTKEPLQVIPNPRHLDKVHKQLVKWERRKARRWSKGKPTREQSAGWHEAKQKVAKLHWQVKCARKDTQNHLTKSLATQYAHIIIEDLSVKQMTKSAKGTLENPGKNVKVKATLNREVLAVGFRQIREQLEYKTLWYGSELTAINPAYTSQTCSACGNAAQRTRDRNETFLCAFCGYQARQGINAARNILHKGNQPEGTS